MIHIYYGYGKGKTSAALGLALRACGAGKKVDFFSFLRIIHLQSDLQNVILIFSKTPMR